MEQQGLNFFCLKPGKTNIKINSFQDTGHQVTKDINPDWWKTNKISPIIVSSLLLWENFHFQAVSLRKKEPKKSLSDSFIWDEAESLRRSRHMSSQDRVLRKESCTEGETWRSAKGLPPAVSWVVIICVRRIYLKLEKEYI